MIGYSLLKFGINEESSHVYIILDSLGKGASHIGAVKLDALLQRV